MRRNNVVGYAPYMDELASRAKHYQEILRSLIALEDMGRESAEALGCVRRREVDRLYAAKQSIMLEEKAANEEYVEE